MELFLDSNAHLPLSKQALDAFIEANNSLAGRGHALSPSKPGRAAEAAIEKAREEIALLLGAEISSQIIFTSTCTQACEWGMEIFKKINKDTPIIYTSPTEHPAVAQAINKHNQFNNLLLNIDVDENARIINKDIKDSALISIFVQNEVGLIQPVFESNAKSLFVDMCQAPGKVSMPKLKDIQNLDVAVFGAHKFGGPASVGFMYVKDTSKWFKNDTGSRYFLDRAGTPDVCSIVATAAALKHTLETFEKKQDNMIKFQHIVESGLEELGFEVVSKKAPRSYNTSFFKVPSKYYSHVLMHLLGEKKIYIGLGSACGSVHSGTSPLIKILNAGTVKDFIRVSQEGYYGEREAMHFVSVLKGICEKS